MKQLVTSAIALCAVLSTSAQDIHFSQFWASPLNLNPAQTGFFDGTFRAGGIYRSQWNSVNSHYQTMSAFYDHTFNSPILAGDLVSAGIVLYNDVAGDAKFSNLSILLNGAYHKVLGPNNMLTLGVQGGLTQKSLQKEQLKFPNMFDPGSQDFSLPLNDPLANDPSLKNPDLTVGIQYSHSLNNGTAFYLGATGLHILTPTETFGTNTLNELPMRIVGHGGLSVPLNDKLTLGPKFLFMTQAQAREISVGTDVGYALQNPNYDATVYGGVWYRVGDAAIPYVGLGYNDFRLGLSYDVNVSSLSEASNGKGGFEVSLIYIGHLTSTPTVIVPPCIRI